MMDFFDYSNIKGRSGRMMEHYVGRIFNFCHIPKQESIIIDIPFYEQDPEILTNEILVHIKEEKLLPQEKDEYFIKLNVDGLLREDYQSQMSIRCWWRTAMRRRQEDFDLF